MSWNAANFKDVSYMKRNIFLLLFLVFVPLHFVLAQNDSILIRGYVRDNFTDAKITSGRAFFMNSDSVVLDSMPIRSWGGFRLRVKRDEIPRSCIIRV